MKAEVIERYLPVLRRFLPLLKFLEDKDYGFVIMQLHGRRPAKLGYVPGLETVGEVEAAGDDDLG